MELNPMHPTTQAMHDQWHKLLAILMHKLGKTHVILTLEDIEAAACTKDPLGAITVQELKDGIHIRLVDSATAATYAKQNPGTAG